MNPLAAGARWLARQLRDVPLSSPLIMQILHATPATAAGVRVSEQTALRHMAVWRAVNLTASTVGGLPLRVYRDAPSGRRKELDPPLFRGEAYPDLGWPEFIETQLLHCLLYGNAYALKVLNEAGTAVVRVLPLDPATVTVERGSPTPANPSGKVYQLSTKPDSPLTPAEVLHIPALSYDGLVGMSPIAAARQAIGAGLAAEQVAARMFDSGLLKGGILQAEVDLTDDQAEEIKQRWREKTAGVVRAHEVAVVSNGLKFIDTQMPPKDAQWLEARNFSVQEIARLYGVPADLLMENSNTGNVNVEQRALFWVKFGLHHWVKRLESRYSAHLVPRGQFVEFDLDGLLRGDSATQAEVFSTAIAAKYLTVNEVREILNRPPLPKSVTDPEPPPAPPEGGDEAESPSEPAGARSLRHGSVPAITINVDPTPIEVHVPPAGHRAIKFKRNAQTGLVEGAEVDEVPA